jgi:hypothetical protein
MQPRGILARNVPLPTLSDADIGARGSEGGARGPDSWTARQTAALRRVADLCTSHECHIGQLTEPRQKTVQRGDTARPRATVVAPRMQRKTYSQPRTMQCLRFLAPILHKPFLGLSSPVKRRVDKHFILRQLNHAGAAIRVQAVWYIVILEARIVRIAKRCEVAQRAHGKSAVRRTPTPRWNARDVRQNLVSLCQYSLLLVAQRVMPLHGEAMRRDLVATASKAPNQRGMRVRLGPGDEHCRSDAVRVQQAKQAVGPSSGHILSVGMTTKHVLFGTLTALDSRALQINGD